MEAYSWMQQFKSENKKKTILLFILFPIFLFLITRGVVAIAWDHSTIWYSSRSEASFYQACWYFCFIAIILIIWWIISFTKQKDIMFKLSWAKALDRKDNPELYNIVENLCISKWIPMPQIAIMDNEPWMNAFATWWKAKDSWICFTSGLVQNLNKREIEAVAWHELTHIINKDCLLMYVALIFIWCLTIAWEGIIRIFSYSSSSSSSKSKWIFTLLWLGFLLLWYLFYPLIRLAISRKREYLADLWSVEITHDADSMVSALKKISSNSVVSSANTKISEFFIASPKIITNNSISELNSDNNEEIKNEKTSLRDSHPSISDRIAKIIKYWWISKY